MSDDEQSGDSQKKPGQGGPDDEARPTPPTVLGWSIRLFSFAVVGTLLVYLIVQALSPMTKAKLTVEPQWADARSQNDQYFLPVEIVNDSSDTIRNLTMEIDSGFGEPREIEIALMGPQETAVYTLGLPAKPADIQYTVLRYEGE